MWLLETRGRWRWIVSGVGFALAGLAREDTLVVPAVLMVAHTIRLPGWDRLHAFLFGVLCAAPALAWKVAMWVLLGPSEQPLSWLFSPIPLGGYLGYVQAGLSPSQMTEASAVVAPGLIALGAAGWGLWRGARATEVAVLIVVVLALVVFLGWSPYIEATSSLRVTIGVVLAGALTLPAFRTAGLPNSWWWLCVGLWLSPLPAMLLLPGPY